jgi:hypothetical protein
MKMVEAPHPDDTSRYICRTLPENVRESSDDAGSKAAEPVIKRNGIENSHNDHNDQESCKRSQAFFSCHHQPKETKDDQNGDRQCCEGEAVRIGKIAKRDGDPLKHVSDEIIEPIAKYGDLEDSPESVEDQEGSESTNFFTSFP